MASTPNLGDSNMMSHF